jgi:hypothetical protein
LLNQRAAIAAKETHRMMHPSLLALAAICLATPVLIRHSDEVRAELQAWHVPQIHIDWDGRDAAYREDMRPPAHYHPVRPRDDDEDEPPPIPQPHW